MLLEIFVYNHIKKLYSNRNTVFFKGKYSRTKSLKHIMFYCKKQNVVQNNKFLVVIFTPTKTPFYTVVKTPISQNLKLPPFPKELIKKYNKSETKVFGNRSKR